MIRAITFDLWGTLLDWSPTYLQMVRRLRLDAIGECLAAAGVTRSRETIAGAYERAAERTRACRPDEPAGQTRMRWIVDDLGTDVGSVAMADLVHRMAVAALAADLDPLPGVHETLPALASGHALGVVSNTSGFTPGYVMRTHLRRHDLLRHLSVLAFSDEIGVGKPDVRPFEAALASLGVGSAEAVHVGDTPRDDIAGARAAGYAHTVQFDARRARPGDAAPTAVIHDHRQLPELLRRLDRGGEPPEA